MTDCSLLPKAFFGGSYRATALFQRKPRGLELAYLTTSASPRTCRLWHWRPGTSYPRSYFRQQFVCRRRPDLLSPNILDQFRRAAGYAHRSLRARRPSTCRPTKFELVINVKAAKALGLTIPPTRLARADEVIEARCYPLWRMSRVLAQGKKRMHFGDFVRHFCRADEASAML